MTSKQCKLQQYLSTKTPCLLKEVLEIAIDNCLPYKACLHANLVLFPISTFIGFSTIKALLHQFPTSLLPTLPGMSANPPPLLLLGVPYTKHLQMETHFKYSAACTDLVTSPRPTEERCLNPLPP